MHSTGRTLEDILFSGIVGFSILFTATSVLILIMVAASTIDLRINSPERAAETHIQENIIGIREIVQETVTNDVPLAENHTVRCWRENDPVHVPSENYTVQQCQIRFGSKPQGDVQTIYTVLMKDGHGDLFIIFKSPNHPIADAYLDQETVRVVPENQYARLTNR